MTQDIHTGQWLPFYLRDHMAGATAGVNLFDRVAGGHGDHGVRAQIAQLRAEIDQDRQALGRIMTTLGIRQISLTMLTGVLGEVAGRFKPNGYLTGRSPGADVLELEALTAASRVKPGCGKHWLPAPIAIPAWTLTSCWTCSTGPPPRARSSSRCTPASCALCPTSDPGAAGAPLVAVHRERHDVDPVWGF